MKQDHVKTIREACIRANPGIVELKFGCEVLAYKTDPSESDRVGVVVSQQMEEPFDMVVYFSYDSCPFNLALSRKEFEVIGRPIRLADVLLAIDKKDSSISISCFGAFEKWEPLTVDTYKLIQNKKCWNLKDDSLDHQNDETIDFIYNLLK